MIFSVKERIMLQEILPKTGSIITLKLVADAMDAAGFDEGEIKLLEANTSQEGRVTWNPLMAPKCEKDIPIGPELLKVIRQELDRLNDAGELPIHAISIWDKFEKAELKVIEKPEEPEQEDDPDLPGKPK